MTASFPKSYFILTQCSTARQACSLLPKSAETGCQAFVRQHTPTSLFTACAELSSTPCPLHNFTVFRCLCKDVRDWNVAPFSRGQWPRRRPQTHGWQWHVWDSSTKNISFITLRHWHWVAHQLCWNLYSQNPTHKTWKHICLIWTNYLTVKHILKTYCKKQQQHCTLWPSTLVFQRGDRSVVQVFLLYFAFTGISNTMASKSSRVSIEISPGSWTLESSNVYSGLLEEMILPNTPGMCVNLSQLSFPIHSILWVEGSGNEGRPKEEWNAAVHLWPLPQLSPQLSNESNVLSCFVMFCNVFSCFRNCLYFLLGFIDVF